MKISQTGPVSDDIYSLYCSSTFHRMSLTWDLYDFCPMIRVEVGVRGKPQRKNILSTLHHRYLLSIHFFFLATRVACKSSRARDGSHGMVVTQAVTVTTLDA